MPDTFGSQVKHATGGFVAGEVEAALHQGCGSPGAAMRELLPRVTRLLEVAARTGERYRAVLQVALDRWGGSTLGEVTVGSLDAWYVELLAGAGDRHQVASLQGVFLNLMRMDAVETIAQAPVETATLAILPDWSTPAGVGVGVAAASPAGIGLAVGDAINRARGRRAPGVSVASTLPNVRGSGLWMTSDHLYMVPVAGAPRVVWHLARAEVAGVHLHPRLQLVRHLTIHFTDGSKASFHYTSKRPAAILTAAFGRV